MSSRLIFTLFAVFAATSALVVAAVAPTIDFTSTPRSERQASSSEETDEETARSSKTSQSSQKTNPKKSSTSEEDRPLIVKEPAPTPEGMVWIPGGTFLMGDEDGQADEKPVHEVALDGFWIDKTEITNAEFKEFVEATGYKTIAERKPKREDFADQVPDVSMIPEENLVPGSICFNENFDRKNLRKDHPLWPYQVWKYQKGANWKHPQGPDSSIKDRMDHPVVHVSWKDVQAYCKWAGKRLPTEAEWEYASRGGLKGKTYPWGDELKPNGKWRANIWQGEFPVEHKVKDGYKKTSPVGSFPPNGYGLYDMSGNVWEWCSDFYRPDYYFKSPRRNPKGPKSSFDPQEPNIPKRVQRGGSFMCNANYCIGYRTAARMKGDPASGSFHCGFRCVVTPDMLKERKQLSANNRQAGVDTH